MNQHSLFAKPVAGRKDLRDYQQNAVVAIFDYFAEHEGSPLIVVPTGGGKSIIIAEFITEANEHFPGTKIMVVTHSAILLTQNAEELLGQWPDARISFYSDSIGQKDLSGDTIFAGIQSVYKRLYDLRHTIDVVLVDEAHIIGPDSNSMYRKFEEDIKVINPHVKFVGFTASPFRAGYGMLHKGKNALFTHIAYEISILELIQRGHLSPIVTPDGGVSAKMSTAGVGKSNGDFIASQLAKKNDTADLNKACVNEIMAHGETRNKWLVFTIDIEHCGHVYDELKSRGVDCEMVHSKMDGMDVARAIERFKSGDARCLVNVAMLTTGANFPAIDLLVFMRPTRSPVLYIQMAGRGMRIFPGKTDCLLLDFGGVVEELGPIDQVRVPEKGDGEGEAPVKYCPGEYDNGNKCGMTLHAAVAKCPHCGYEFPPPEINLDAKASEAAVLSPQVKAKQHRVNRIAYFRHKKEGKPDTMRVDYLCGYETYREWVCLEHSGLPREKACNWWKSRSSARPPATITEALERTKELVSPINIYVKKIGKYHEITSVDFVEIEDVDFIEEEYIHL